MKTNLNNVRHFQLTGQYGFRYRTITTDLTPEQQLMQTNTLTHNAIFFQLEGVLQISFGHHQNIIIKPGELYFLPRGVDVSGCLITKEITYVAARLDHHLDNEFTFKQLLRHEDQERIEQMPFAVLPIKEPMVIFLESIKRYIIDGVENQQLQNMKFVELYTIFRSYYTKKECISLLHPIVKKSSKFKTYILDNYSVDTSIEELASKANMSRSTFDRNFKEAFGMTPHKWFDTQTRALIIRKASEPNVTIKDIMFEIGVYNPSQFTQLCKRLCGVIPSELIRLH